MKYFVALITFLGISLQAQAGILLDFGGTYITDAMTSSANTSSTKYLYEVGVLFSLSKTVWGGWSYLGVSHSDTIPGSSTSYASMDTGPTLKWFFGKNELCSLSGTFNVVSRATYSTGSAAQEKWEGMSYLVSFGLMPEVGEGFHIGASLNYYSANYTKKIVNNTESSTTNSKTWMFPTINLSKAW